MNALSYVTCLAVLTTDTRFQFTSISARRFEADHGSSVTGKTLTCGALSEEGLAIAGISGPKKVYNYGDYLVQIVVEGVTDPTALSQALVARSAITTGERD
jgi:hypothetical protein